MSDAGVMSIEQAARQGRVFARLAVQGGLVDPESVRALFQEYGTFVQAGVRGSFAQLLLARNVIDESGYQLLLAKATQELDAVPPDTRTGDDGSRSDSRLRSDTRARSGTGDTRDTRTIAEPEIRTPDSNTIAYDAVYDPTLDTTKARSSTIGYREVLEPAKAEALEASDPGLTMDYDRVLAAPDDETSHEPTGTQSVPRGLVSREIHKSESAVPPEFRRSASEVILAPDAEASQEAAFFSLDDDSIEDAQLTLKEPTVGDVLGDYTLEKVIGRGGMGVIYLARKGQTEERYALKTLTVGQGERGKHRRARFQREVEALRRLEHPNIVKVHTCGRKGPFDFYVMEYVKGQELKALLKAEQLTRRSMLDIFIDVCKAVHHAHERSVIHRDLKPGNVLIDGKGHVYVLDFGLAKLIDDVDALTRTGSALGTPYYMAPEQLTNPKDVDPRSDVWSLGVMLYEMLVGKRPFRGETTGEITSKILNEDPVKPSLLVEGLDPGVDAVCMKALQREPDRRYPDVDALRRDAARLRRGGGIKGASELDQAAEALRRFVERQKEGLLMGVFLASLVYVPVIYFVYKFL